MSGGDDDQAELLRRFEAAISGMETADLRRLAGDLTQFGPPAARRAARPELRRPRQPEVMRYRIRVDLDHAEPPIWRRLDLRSDLTLDVVHQVLQVAFDWTDSHLHRFSLGGDPFAPNSQLFLCPFDVEEGDAGDEGGVPTGDVRLDETLQEPGDVLRYVYDYGDSWELTLRLEEVLPASPTAPSAVVAGGRRAAPPEDSGGAVDLASLSLVLEDPARFDVGELDEALRNPYFVLTEYGVDQRLVDLVNRLRFSSVGEDLAARAVNLVSEPARPADGDVATALRAHRWFLDRAVDGGIPLTSAGYLRPADVEAASLVVPAMADWIGKNNRESLAAPLLDFRESLRSLGLLRKYKGTLRLTRVGAEAQRDPSRLWDLLASKLIPTGEGFETDATLLLLLYAATSADRTLPLGQLAEALGRLGWRHRDGRALEGYELSRLPAFDTLANVSDSQAGHRRGRIDPTGAALARAALQQSR